METSFYLLQADCNVKSQHRPLTVIFGTIFWTIISILFSFLLVRDEVWGGGVQTIAAQVRDAGRNLFVDGPSLVPRRK